VRTVISGPSTGSGQAGAEAAGADKGDAAAAVLEGFEGVALDPQAEAEIGAALEACAARAREAAAAYEQGGLAAADAAERDPAESFFRSDLCYRGELVPAVTLEEFVPFREGERPWTDAGADVVDWVPAAAAEAPPEGPKRKSRA
jgi:hypothetical protein